MHVIFWVHEPLAHAQLTGKKKGNDEVQLSPMEFGENILRSRRKLSGMLGSKGQKEKGMGESS